MNKFINKILANLKQAQTKILLSYARIQFARSIHGNTKTKHYKIIADAEQALKNKEIYESEAAYSASSDLLVKQGHALKKQVENEFRNKYAEKNNERIMIHVPAPEYSPAGYSLLTNLAECLSFMGIPTHMLGWNDSTEVAIKEFKPTLLLTSDHASYLERIEWNVINKYRESSNLKIGLSASLAEYGNTPLAQRLEWAKRQKINFYYSYRDEGYVNNRAEYNPFIESGFQIMYLPFGANILHYYPVAGFERDIDFVLIASKKREHAVFMKGVVNRSNGFIDGPGWKHATHFSFNKDRDRYIYARAKVGLNVHLPEQIDWACEVNERTYQLAACGVPEVIDHPKLLDKIFSKNAMFVADTPKQFEEHFRSIIKNPKIGQERALLAQREVFSKHTTFHRAESFLLQINALH